MPVGREAYKATGPNLESELESHWSKSHSFTNIRPAKLTAVQPSQVLFFQDYFTLEAHYILLRHSGRC